MADKVKNRKGKIERGIFDQLAEGVGAGTSYGFKADPKSAKKKMERPEFGFWDLMVGQGSKKTLREKIKLAFDAGKYFGEKTSEKVGDLADMVKVSMRKQAGADDILDKGDDHFDHEKAARMFEERAAAKDEELKGKNQREGEKSSRDRKSKMHKGPGQDVTVSDVQISINQPDTSNRMAGDVKPQITHEDNDPTSSKGRPANDRGVTRVSNSDFKRAFERGQSLVDNRKQKKPDPRPTIGKKTLGAERQGGDAR